MEQSKACLSCKQIVIITLFHKRTKSSDGLSSICKLCKKVIDSQYAKDNKQKIAQYRKQWGIDNRQHINQKNLEWRKANPIAHKQSQTKYADNNREQKRIANKQWSAANYDLHRALIADWQKRNPEAKRLSANKRRAKIMNNGHAPYSEKEVLATYGNKCHICNGLIDMKAARKVGQPGWQFGLHIEHLVPINLGGADTLQNVRPAHGLCNLKKGCK